MKPHTRKFNQSINQTPQIYPPTPLEQVDNKVTTYTLSEEERIAYCNKTGWPKMELRYFQRGKREQA